MGKKPSYEELESRIKSLESKLETEVTRGVESLHVAGWRAAHTRVRGVELSDHLVAQIIQILVFTDVLEEGLVARLDCFPVKTMHVLVVETVFHDSPGFFKDLLP